MLKLFGATAAVMRAIDGVGPGYKPDRYRRRTSGSSVLTSKHILGVNNLGTVIANVTETGRRTFSAYRVTDDVVPDRYFTRRRNGEIFNLPYKSSLVTTAFPTGPMVATTASGEVWTYTGSDAVLGFWNRSGLYGSLETDSPLSPTFDAPEVLGISSDEELRDVATVNARLNVIKAESLALVTIAELSKTKQMLLQMVGDLGQAMKLVRSNASKDDVLRVLRRSRRKHGRKIGSSSNKGSLLTTGWVSKTVASRWLEIRYGWMPLFYDIQGTLKALTGDHHRLNTARGFANDSVSITTPKSMNSPFWGFNYNETVTLEKRFRAYILYEAELEGFHLQKLGFLQVPASGYEVVPFSFVLDWFINLGDWLDAMSPRTGVTIKNSGYVVSKVYSCVREITQFVPGTLITATGVTGSYDTVSIRTKKRVPFLPPLPLPRFNVRMNWTRVTDAIALIRQQARFF